MFQAHQDILDLADIQAAVFLDIQDSVEYLEPLDLKVYLAFQESADFQVLAFQAHQDIQDLADILDQVFLDILDLAVSAVFLVRQAHRVFQDIQVSVDIVEQLANQAHQDILDTQV